ncbi:hypothetical protein TraAM80_06596 [Trypanosoma rangeli]|uniref:Uncharacterized protein n=1 Tax=Trypanosoma rangeli TaxID=5698 RepID=A0A422N9M4_TRYRA|nr:uncharacterized protein TraAM80_06596 [Trypanosoma rangeli]RNF02184.1 hypothetical protein TraAM80_06596 [Trypanosoma rangeli]|eukprot:RNF02184.1 hypothetical protein TraAM80_06596 [Trypanosoma rangeli]
MAHTANVALVPGNTKKKNPPPPLPPRLFVPLWRFLTVELLIYAVCHIVCLGLALFAATDVSLSDLVRGMLRQLRGPPQEQPPSDRSPFEVLRGYRQAAASGPVLPSHEVNSDLLLTLLVPFSLHAFFLALMRRIEDVGADERRKQEEEAGTEPSQATGPTNGDKGAGTVRPWWMVDCDLLMKHTLIGFTCVLCPLIPICVFPQEASEVRGLGPAAGLLSIAVGMCVLEVHGGMRGVRTTFNCFQALIIAGVVVLVAVAHLCPKE